MSTIEIRPSEPEDEVCDNSHPLEPRNTTTTDSYAYGQDTTRNNTGETSTEVCSQHIISEEQARVLKETTYFD